MESVVPSVGTAHSFTEVALNANGLAKNLPPTLGCRFGDRVTVLAGMASHLSTLSAYLEHLRGTYKTQQWLELLELLELS